MFDEITRAVREALTTGAGFLPALPGGGDPSLQSALDALDAAAAAIRNAADLDAWVQAVQAWHEAQNASVPGHHQTAPASI